MHGAGVGGKVGGQIEGVCHVCQNPLKRAIFSFFITNKLFVCKYASVRKRNLVNLLINIITQICYVLHAPDVTMNLFLSFLNLALIGLDKFR